MGVAEQITVAGPLPNVGNVIGIYRGGVWVLDLDKNRRWSGKQADGVYRFGGLPQDIPVVGDWDGDGRDELGIYRGGVWVLDLDKNRRWSGKQADGVYRFGGLPQDIPVVGDLTGMASGLVNKPKLQVDGIQVISFATGSKPEKLEFAVEGEGIQSVELVVYDLKGRQVYRSGPVASLTVRWNLLDREGRQVANGVYLYQILAQGCGGAVLTSQVKKVVVLR
jgi:hypothetical protein